MPDCIDLCLRPKDESYAEVMFQASRNIGYSAVGSVNHSSDIIDVVKRADLYPRNRSDLTKHLRRLRRRAEIIVVHPLTRSVALQAVVDNRVDLVAFPINTGGQKLGLDRRLAGLMRDSGVGLEVIVRDLLVNDRHVLANKVPALKRNVEAATKHNLPVVASSGATDTYELREPQGIAALLGLVGLDPELALETVSTIPLRLVTDNREKLKNSYILPGVWVIDSE